MYNIDTNIYAASSFKGPYSAFVCSKYLDSEQLDFSTEVACDTASCLSGTSYDGVDTIYNLMEATIISSSNEAYTSMRSACSDETLSQWLASIGVDSGKAYEMLLPFFSTRDMTKMWLYIYNYLQSENPSVETLTDLYSKTDMSFIRSALGESESGDLTVLNKGGWFRPDDEAYNSVVDCGIVKADGRDYLICVMTGAGWSDVNIDRIQDLIYAVFSAREDLFMK